MGGDGEGAGQGSGEDVLNTMTFGTFELSPGAGGEFCASQFGLNGGGGGGGVLVAGKVRSYLTLQLVLSYLISGPRESV